MMESALRQRLKDDAGVAAIVGTRIDWIERPQRSAFPAVVLQIVSAPRPQHMAGVQSFRQSRVQFDCFATTAKEAAELCEAVIAAILPAATVSATQFLRGFINDVRDLGEDTDGGFVHRRSIDAYIWHE